MGKHVLSIDQLVPEPIGGFEGIRLCYGVRPHTVGSRNLSVNYVVTAPGCGTGYHAHPEEAWYIIRGRGVLRVRDERFSFQARDLLYVAADVPHQVVNDGDEPLEMITITAPPVDFTPSGNTVVIEAFDPARHL